MQNQEIKTSFIELSSDNFAPPIIGIDEVGRGPLAGPVVACAFLLDSISTIPDGVKDSKKLSNTKRQLFAKILTKNTKYAIGIASVEEIDKLNILNATKLAMQRAFCQLENENYQKVLIDGNLDPLNLPGISQSIIKGDSKSLAIACASIIAKVYRDNLMNDLHNQHPDYGWNKNSGYGTKSHIEQIRSVGITKHHRSLFVRNFIKTA